MSTTKAPRTPRSVVNMPAIESTPAAAAASVKKVRDVALVSTLVLAVTAAGVAVGALGIAPFLRNEPMQRIENAAVAVLGMVFEAAGAVAADSTLAVVLGVACALCVGVVVAYRMRRRSANTGIMKIRRKSSPASAMAFSTRTPRDVQVLAAAGQAPVDIAVRTRMSVDAVSMLLQLGQGETVRAAR